jgi:hypothetical protein
MQPTRINKHPRTMEIACPHNTSCESMCGDTPRKNNPTVPPIMNRPTATPTSPYPLCRSNIGVLSRPFSQLPCIQHPDSDLSIIEYTHSSKGSKPTGCSAIRKEGEIHNGLIPKIRIEAAQIPLRYVSDHPANHPDGENARKRP